jgi:hypothetical protein
MEQRAQVRLNDLAVSEPEGTAVAVLAVPILAHAIETLHHSGGVGRFGLCYVSSSLISSGSVICKRGGLHSILWMRAASKKYCEYLRGPASRMRV